MNRQIPAVMAVVAALMLAPANPHAQQAAETPPAPQTESAPTAAAPTTSEQPATQAPERQNDQTLVIGAGFGGHAFATPHRAGQDTQIIVSSSLMQQIYAEWYVFDAIGLGLRLHGFGETASGSTTVTVGGNTVAANSEVDLSVGNVLITATWVPIGGRRYVRMGVVGGLGRSSYEFTEINTPGGTTTVSTSGPAALVGAYVDWGADGLGGRAGLQYLATSLGSAGGRDVDVSGRDVFVDLRWGF